MSHRWAAVVTYSMCIFLTAACSAVPREDPGAAGVAASPTAAPAAVAAGCEPAVMPTVTKAFDAFTPASQQRSQPSEVPILEGKTRVARVGDLALAGGFSVKAPRAEPPGRQLQDVLVSGEGSAAEPYFVALYYAAKPLGASESVRDFLARDGIFVTQKYAGDAGTADDVVSELGDRAVRVKVGPYDAALVHGDPIGSDDVRPYSLYWSDGTYDWSVIGRAAPEQVMDVGRSVACR